MDEGYDELHSQVFSLDRNGKADVLDYLCISIVDEGWRYRVRGKAHEDIILAALALDLRSRIKLRDELMDEPDPELDEMWAKELDRRMEQHRRGEATYVTAEESVARARRVIEEWKERNGKSE